MQTIIHVKYARTLDQALAAIRRAQAPRKRQPRIVRMPIIRAGKD